LPPVQANIKTKMKSQAVKNNSGWDDDSPTQVISKPKDVNIKKPTSQWDDDDPFSQPPIQ